MSATAPSVTRTSSPAGSTGRSPGRHPGGVRGPGRTVLELFQGRLSDHVLRVVTDPDRVLFPKPGEITLHLRLSRLGGDVQARARRTLPRRQPARRPSRAALPPAGRRRRRPGRRRHGVAERADRGDLDGGRRRRGGGRRPPRRSRGHLRHRSPTRRTAARRPLGRGPPDAADAAGGRVGPAPRRPASSLRAAGSRSSATRADSRSPSSQPCAAYPQHPHDLGQRSGGVETFGSTPSTGTWPGAALERKAASRAPPYALSGRRRHRPTFPAILLRQAFFAPIHDYIHHNARLPSLQGRPGTYCQRGRTHTRNTLSLVRRVRGPRHGPSSRG